MTDSAETTSAETTPAGGSQPVSASAGASWSPGPTAQEAAAGAAAEHPELLIGAAFAGGLVLAMILKRLAR